MRPVPAPKETPDIHIGSRLWFFDENRRRYSEPEPGKRYGDIIWREHFREEEVVGETSRSWLVGLPGTKPEHTWALTKLAKKQFRNGACPRGWVRSEEQLDQQAWVHENRYKITVRLQNCSDYAVLKNIESLLRLAENDSK